MITRHTEWTLIREEQYSYWTRTAGLVWFTIHDMAFIVSLDVRRWTPEGVERVGEYYTQTLADAKQLAEAIATLSEGGWDE